MVTHKGACHCRRVQFEVRSLLVHGVLFLKMNSKCLLSQFDAPKDVIAWDCNCSICTMKRNTHTIVPSSRFRLVEGSAEALSQPYTFGTHTAKHLFCRTCGICTHYIPRSNPDGVAVTIFCIEKGTLNSIDIRSYDGQRWDEAYVATGIASQTKLNENSTNPA